MCKLALIFAFLVSVACAFGGAHVAHTFPDSALFMVGAAMMAQGAFGACAVFAKIWADAQEEDSVAVRLED